MRGKAHTHTRKREEKPSTTMYGKLPLVRHARRLFTHLADNSSVQFFGGFSSQRTYISQKSDLCPGLTNVKEFLPYALTSQKLIHSGRYEDLRNNILSKRMNTREGKDIFGAFGSRNKDVQPGMPSSLNYVKEVLSTEGTGIWGSSQFPQQNIEQNADFVHINLMRNNTFITVADSNGNKKLGASAGCLSEMKGGPKLSRYAAEATAEHVGRLSRSLGIKSVVMRVKGFTYFKKKRQAILSWKEGFSGSRFGKSPIVYIEDVTRKAHNGCRRSKKRRI